MRIDKMNTMLDEKYGVALIKECGKNYAGLERLDSPRQIVQVMNDLFYLNKRAEEYVYLLAMTAKNRVIGVFEVSHGTGNTSLAGIREILIRSLLSGAMNIVIVHNHPSGEPEPSKQDMQVTERLKQASRMVGIYFCDHIIIGRDGFYSFRQNEEES